MGATVLLLQLSAAVLACANLLEVSGSALKEVHVHIDEKTVENKTTGVELNIDLDDIPEDMMDEILRGEYSKIIELERSIAVMNESDIADDDMDGEEDLRIDRSIIGRDDRLPVTDRFVSQYPYGAIGYLEGGCTAALIGPNHALTAAHCVYNRNTRTYRTNLDLWLGQTCNSPGTRLRYAHKAFVPRGYVNYGRSEYDYALLLYEDSSFYFLSIGYKNYWPDYGFDLIGYPGDKHSDDLSHCSYHSMFYSGCHYSDTHGSYRFRYRCDSQPGNSGSPIMSQKSGDETGKRVVYGVHTSGAGDTTYNYGARITKSRFCCIVNWMRDNGYTAECGGRPCCSLFSSSEETPEGCFSPYDTVITADRKMLEYVKDLKIGDSVLATSATGELVYSPVIAFIDKSPEQETSFLKIETENNELFLTPTHLIFRQVSSSGSFASSEAVFASSIKSGDYVFVVSSNMSMFSERVNSVSSLKIRGAYAPLTAEGTIVVNNVATSCYAVVENHHLLHTAFAPLRYLYSWLPGLFHSPTEQKGQHWYTHLLAEMGHYIYPYATLKSELSSSFYNFV